MSTFETQHPRGTGGRFATKQHSESAVDLHVPAPPEGPDQPEGADATAATWTLPASSLRDPLRPTLPGLSHDEDDEFRVLDAHLVDQRRLSAAELGRYASLADRVQETLDGATGAESRTGVLPLPDCPMHGRSFEAFDPDAVQNAWGADPSCRFCCTASGPRPLGERADALRSVSAAEARILDARARHRHSAQQRNAVMASVAAARASLGMDAAAASDDPFGPNRYTFNAVLVGLSKVDRHPTDTARLPELADLLDETAERYAKLTSPAFATHLHAAASTVRTLHETETRATAPRRDVA